VIENKIYIRFFFANKENIRLVMWKHQDNKTPFITFYNFAVCTCNIRPITHAMDF